MQPDNPIVGGTVLRRAAIQSPDYVAGSTGWAIFANGTAEFNQVTVRGTVEAIAANGAEVKIDPATAQINLWPAPGAASYIGAIIDAQAVGPVGVGGTLELITPQPIAGGPYRNARISLRSADATNDPFIEIDASPGQVAVQDSLVMNNTITTGAQVCAAQNGVNGVSAGDTTTSATYVNMAAGNSSFTLTKMYTATRIKVEMHVGSFSTVNNTQVDFAVLINGTDYKVTQYFFNAANDHRQASGVLYVPAGVPAGAQTIQGRWLRSAGTGTLTRNTGDWISISAQEVA